jgi:hypothetical protein
MVDVLRLDASMKVRKCVTGWHIWRHKKPPYGKKFLTNSNLYVIIHNRKTKKGSKKND